MGYMKIKHASRHEAINAIVTSQLTNTSLISISDDIFEEKEMRHLCEGAFINRETSLFLRFEDIEIGYNGFTRRTAAFVIQFIQMAFNNKRDLYIHCLVGQSRSGAIAKFANEYWGCNDEYLNNYKHYNNSVYNTLVEEFNYMWEGTQ